MFRTDGRKEERLGAAAERRSVPSGSVQSQLVLTRRVGGTVLDLLVQLCGGDGGAVLVGMMAQAFPAGEIARSGTKNSDEHISEVVNR